MNAQQIESIFKIWQAQNPTPKTELNYRNHFELLVSVMLSAQSTDKAVNLATPALFNAAPNPKAMLDLGETKIKTYIRTLGLFNSKAQNVYKTCKILVEEYSSQLPVTRQGLETLPGVGVKTAGVVLNVAYAQTTIPVDTHVFRVSNRLGLVQTKTANQTEPALQLCLPNWVKTYAHHWLILHGRYVCKAQKPNCPECTVQAFCEFQHKTTATPSKKTLAKLN